MFLVFSSFGSAYNCCHARCPHLRDFRERSEWWRGYLVTLGPRGISCSGVVRVHDAKPVQEYPNVHFLLACSTLTFSLHLECGGLGGGIPCGNVAL